jgi:hypothetical protein
MKQGNAHAPHSAAADAGAWFSNVATSVLIVFVNKILMSSTGYKFQFGELPLLIYVVGKLFSATRLCLTYLLVLLQQRRSAHCTSCQQRCLLV